MELNAVNIPEDIPLADPEFNVSVTIYMLLGAELFYELLCNEQIKQVNQLILQNTRFGWVVSNFKERIVNSNKSMCNVSRLSDIITRFWNVE